MAEPSRGQELLEALLKHSWLPPCGGALCSMDELEHYNELLARSLSKRNRAQSEGCGDEGLQKRRKSRGREVGSKNAARTRIDDLPDDTLQAIKVPDSAPEVEGRGGMGEGVASEAAVAGGGGAAAESAAGAEAALQRILHVQLQIAQRERIALHETIRSKDAEIERLRRLAYGIEVIDVEAGVTRIVVEEAGTGASPPPPPWKRRRKEQAASAHVIGALQQRLVEVKKEHVEERAVRHSELRASVDVKLST